LPWRKLDAGLTVSDAARRMGVARSTVREMVGRFERSGLAWPLPLDLTDTDLETRLYGEAGTKQGYRRRPEPDWTALNREMKRKHVTLQILWDEYYRGQPRRLSLQPLLRPLSGLGSAPAGDHAPDPPGRRQAV
jgi:transposase